MADRLHHKVRVLVAENFDLIHIAVDLVAETGDIANLFPLVAEHRSDAALIDWQLSECNVPSTFAN